jgi:hypothetical protein
MISSFPFVLESVLVKVGIVYLDKKSSVLSCPIDGGNRIFMAQLYSEICQEYFSCWICLKKKRIL